MAEPIELPLRVIEGNRPGPHLLITGGVHGDEFEPMVACRALIRQLSSQDLAGRVTIVPVVNLAAYCRGNRVADDGLDLARTCPGKTDGSITERTAHALSELIRSADYYIDLHTGGTTLSVLPLTGYMLHADPQVLEKQRAMARAFNLPIVWGTDPSLSGRSLSVALDAGVPAIYAEYRGAAQCDPAGVAAYVEGCLNVMGSLEMLRRPAPASRVTHVIEDPRPNSGHLQICHRAPCDGYFHAAVELGQHVAEGTVLGWIEDVLGDSRETVPAAQNGLVLVLRTFPTVTEGDSLAVILETPKG